MNAVFEELKPFLDKQKAYQGALALMQWDNETLAPEDANEFTSNYMGILSQEAFVCMINPQIKEILARLQKEENLDEYEKRVLKKLVKYVKKNEMIPPEEMREHAELTSRAVNAWQKAKKAEDFSAYAPYLEKLIAYAKKFAGYGREEGQKLYDVMLDDYEESFDVETLDRFFSRVKEEIVPLLKKIQEKERRDYPFLSKTYDVQKQKEFCHWLAGYIGFDFKRGVLAESEHPFTIGWHNRDVRITTHYYPENMIRAIFSTIHEVGHALYEQGIDDKYTLTMLGQGTSCGIHESQSRFMENIVGRSEAFWKPIYQRLQEMFPEQLGGVTLESFVQAVNLVEPGLIRTEADELTYCLHVMVRYELEKQMIEEEVEVSELPDRWNQKYQEYLGLTPSANSQGILQDIHWSMGSFGYFPSYALGNAFAAQIYHQMKKELDVGRLLEEGKISEVVSYLRKHIHQYGACKDARELLGELSGEEFNADYYIEYMKEKYTRIYGL